MSVGHLAMATIPVRSRGHRAGTRKPGDLRERRMEYTRGYTGIVGICGSMPGLSEF